VNVLLNCNKLEVRILLNYLVIYTSLGDEKDNSAYTLVLWLMESCSLEGGYNYFGETYYILYLQGTSSLGYFFSLILSILAKFYFAS
jgi:hypothetical protein